MFQGTGKILIEENIIYLSALFNAHHHGVEPVAPWPVTLS